MADGRLMLRGRKQYNGPGVYVFRGQRPGLFGRIPLIGRHFLYVGESAHVRSRYDQHMNGSVRYNQFPKPWAGLKPTWYYIPLPPWKPLRLTVETLLIAGLWPVYNHQKNLWNPRRIPLKTASRQAAQRAAIGWSFNFRFGHAVLWLVLAGVCWQKGWY
jgi:hypothetical protein